jgi:hypothetical protein
MMTREQAKAAYRRVGEWERQASARLRDTILIPLFGGCACRQHNCRVNYESGVHERGVTVRGVYYSHADLAVISRRYDHEQRAIWERCKRLQAHFAKMF